ncbi:flagellar basal-body MS-ring/collar protein FliF [Acetohalobium arabaticum]|uniref:Flagellar M-ring protein n=1 Tax=Acetohalobium arabaticum (strain ATCC 49924 / DSM 5501 / Z-7288) TaxID=574087 RepID=D9QRL0_ACEAZ|nr:flagellar basal-body MS-ring/collar protein FliF [Acetohalobium arabaticum]ADL13151.1 flagellar M-ring protein FliF [Acetohalobium arabaticum DSM 5501]
MIENLKQMIEQVKELWNNLDTKAKVIISSSAIVSIIVLLLVTNWASQPNYVTLFNDLTMKDAGAITKQLDEKQIDYKLGADGTKISVPAQKVHQVRLDLASKGLPQKGAVGFEIFDKNQLGSTDFEQQVNFYRALSGELARSIMHLQNVKFAKVQISAPRESLYLDKKKVVKASVMLKMKEYAELDLKQVEGITNLVASSVEDLKPENVTVVDDRGNLLTAELNKEDKFNNTDFSPKLLELENDFESNMESELNTMLSKVLGPDNVVVRVNAKLNFDRRQMESRTYEPVNDDQGVVRSEQSTEVSYSGQGDTPSGVPGTESNIPGYEGGEEQSSNYDKEETTTNYEINEKIETYTQVPGDVEKMSVAVMVDKELSPAQTESIRQSVESAVGYSAERGDQITITNFEFDRSLEKKMTAEMEAQKSAEQRRWIIIGIITILVLIIGFLILRRLRSGSGRAGDGGQGAEELDVVVDDQGQTETAATEEKELSPEERKRKEMKEEISDLVEQQPEEVARLLKTWLAEE